MEMSDIKMLYNKRFGVVKTFVTVLAETFSADRASLQNCAKPRRLGRFRYSNRRYD